jgi:hypothetical protein
LGDLDGPAGRGLAASRALPSAAAEVEIRKLLGRRRCGKQKSSGEGLSAICALLTRLFSLEPSDYFELQGIDLVYSVNNLLLPRIRQSALTRYVSKLSRASASVFVIYRKPSTENE